MSSQIAPSPSGLLLIDKPSGCTSHDVVSRVRKVMQQKRVGHGGTLDPIASGVLLVAVGRATRLLEYVAGHDKSYNATLLLGIETDTLDVTGSVLSENDASAVTLDCVQAATTRLAAATEQTPPMYSAVKIGGQPLYKSARAGIELERKPRPVTVHSLKLASFRPGAAAEADLEMTVSAGFYVRQLCHDLGNALGVGGCMKSLLRTSSGGFTLEQTVPLDALDPRTAAARLLPCEAMIAHLPGLDLDANESLKFCAGGVAACHSSMDPGMVRVHGPSGLLGVGQLVAGDLVKPVKVLV